MGSALALKKLFANYYLPDDPDEQRQNEFVRHASLVCTPFSGGDLDVDGWVICAMGSPPKGTLILFGGGQRQLAAYHIYAGSRQIDLSSEQQVIRSFYDEHLRGKTEPITIP